MFTIPLRAGFGIVSDWRRTGRASWHDGAEGFQAMLTMNAETGQGIAISELDNGIAVAEDTRAAWPKNMDGNTEAQRSDANNWLIAALKEQIVCARYDELKNSPTLKSVRKIRAEYDRISSFMHLTKPQN